MQNLQAHHKWIIGLVASAVIGPLILWWLTHEGGQTVHMTTFLTNAATGTQFKPVKAFDPRPDSDVDQASQETAVHILGRGQYKVTFVLQDPDGTELDRVTSGVVTIRWRRISRGRSCRP